MNIVLNSNILWSAAYNPKSRIGQFIVASDSSIFKFYSPSFLRIEIEKHFAKIVLLSKQSDEEIRETLNIAYSKIIFIDDEIIPIDFYHKAFKLVWDIDKNDIVYLSLNEYIDAYLWTGDQKLYDGLKGKGYKKVLNFNDLLQLVNLKL